MSDLVHRQQIGLSFKGGKAGADLEHEAKADAVGRCLEQMDALRVEWETASAAIVANALSAFEESVGRQQELIRALSLSLPAARAATVEVCDETGMGIAARFDEALCTGRKWNAQYAALLEHTGRSMRMLQSLYGMKSTGMSTPKPADYQQTWSLQG